ncbi:MAG: hypothetical protein NC541_15880 [bacterium]|nr:hypothetical protein [bacterium]
MKHSKSSLFLMELIIVILFFSLASAVCIQFFARSHILSKETVEQNNAITQAQNLAETWYAADGNTHSMLQLLDGSISSENEASIFLLYDRDWKPLSSAADDVFYVAELSLLPADAGSGLTGARVSVYSLPASANWTPEADASRSDSYEVIYSLELVLHIAERRSSLE